MTNLRFFFRKNEFGYLFLRAESVNNSIQIGRFIGSTNSWNYVMSSLKMKITNVAQLDRKLDMIAGPGSQVIFKADYL